MEIHFVIHEAFEGKGYLEQWIEERGYICSHTLLYLGESLPSKPFDFDCLIVLGGPQSPSTSNKEYSYFDSEAEQLLISNSILENKAVVGICLGAQLIGQALGAKYEKSPEREIGYFPIQLTNEGQNDELFSDFNLSELVGHWHNDMPGLTESAKILAISAGCPRQIIRYSELVYGFQCHLEFIKKDLPLLIKHSGNDFSIQNNSRFIQDKSEILKISTIKMNKLLGKFMDNLMMAYSNSRIADN
ncbi:glutamine amidotransferase-related protein [Psychromonas sp. SR45-3]|uniref:glutamine amidotransferase-related protein n=1 Tax=Psychromonas sp. SR45-3 TaxID=2760930 RepID=UPI0015FD2522|nr:glutamine amidotransferase [Psychromonas sp. SR45-3]MBB1274512.1 glutamine amidotransferase [Psychromonas sp. SR45-3]